MHKLAALFALAIYGALLPETTQLTDNCTTVWSNCTRPVINDTVDNATLCTSGQSYITCLADALTTAERGGVCSPLFLLTHRHDAFSEAAVYQHNCPEFALPSSLALDDCGTEIAVCGRYARNVHIANSTGDSVTKCRELRTFQSCMETNTSRCADRNTVNNLLLKELVDYQCVPCGVVRASRPSSRIVGGSPAGANQFPWVVMLVENGRFICGGALIDPLHVVTAAHCVEDADSYDGFLDTSAFEIVAGKHRASLAVNYSGEQRVSVAAAVLHPRYEVDPGFSANDIAVLRLERPLTFNSKVSALCLPERTARLPEQCVVAGWGRDGVGSSSSFGDLAEELMAVTVPVFSREQCRALQSIIGSGYHLDTNLAQNTMCITNTSHGGQGTCTGDSGSPVFCAAPGGSSYQMMGVVSWGFGNCRARPAVPNISTFVPPYITWIDGAKNSLRSACASLPCGEHGSCHDNGTSFTCTCRAGFTGPRCDVGQSPDEGRIRLVNGSHPREGRVEVLVNGRWGTVCDDDWGVQDARVVCRQLGYNTTAARAYSSAHFGRGSANATIWLDDVSCSGYEAQLLDCPAQPLGTHNCGHNEDAGVSCGTSQVFNACASGPCLNGATCVDHNGSFTCTCSSEFTGPRCEVRRACASNPCLNGGSCVDGDPGHFFCICDTGFYGPRCQVSNACTSGPCLNGATCVDHNGSFTCTCRSDFTGPRCEVRQSPDEARIRLVNGSHPREGRVEVLVNGRWGTVCDDGWGVQDARVVCRQLGYNTTAARAYSNAHFGRGNAMATIWLDDVSCSGLEAQLLDCPAQPLGTHNCGHNEDAGVSCGTSQGQSPDEARIRLVNGSHPREGRVEVLVNGRWGTVCDDGWGVQDARVVCRQLGYSTTAARAYSNAHFGQGSVATIWLDDVRCSGLEAHLLDCPAQPLGTHNCGHGEDAGVSCGTS